MQVFTEYKIWTLTQNLILLTIWGGLSPNSV